MDAGAEKLIRELETRGIPWVRVPLDIEEIRRLCEKNVFPAIAHLDVNLASRKAQQNAR